MLQTSSFEKRYKNLNESQKKAVDTIEGPVLVVAGPGTGKTTILTLRIANILKRTQISPNGILAITYTNTGVKAMREKLCEIIGNTAHDVHIHTFHSFAGAMISEYPEHFIRVSDFNQLTPVEGESLIRNILAKPEYALLRPLGRPDIYLSSIERAISNSKKEALTPIEITEFANLKIKEIESDEANISTRGASKGKLKAEVMDKIEKLQKTLLFAKVYQDYEEMKEKSKLRDYDDLIIEFLVALRTDELFLRLIQERFLYILVDEHQDTNDSQNFIIGLIAEFFETPNVFVVGDDKQAVYRFQGASVENFLRFQKLWPKMKVISLETNYRSHQDILDASFSMIENNYEPGEHADLRIKLKSESGKKRPIDIISSENTLAMEDYLVGELKNIVSSEPESTVAIITRRNRELERVLRLLETNDILVSSERSVDIFHHPIGRAFFDLLEFIADPSRMDALISTIVVGMWGLSYKESLDLVAKIKTNQSDISLALPALANIQKIMLSDSAVGALIHIAEDSGFTSLVSRDPAFVHVWRGIVTLSESLARDGKIENPLDLVKALLVYKQSAETKTVKVSVGAPDFQIKAMTAHGSKGLEFDYVFIPYAGEESWVGRHLGSSFYLPEKSSSDNDIRDIRRLFYVAITRARKHVSVLYSLEESDGKTLSPLRFINELQAKSLNLKVLPRMEFSLSPESIEKAETTPYQNLLQNQAKKVLLDSGLSVTALNHFLECPSKFLYESVLRLPQAPSVSSDKGNAMHSAISSVWIMKDRSVPKIEETIKEVTAEYINKTFLSVSDKKAVKKELADNAEVVAKALHDHFNSPGQIRTEKWMEAPFDTIFSGEPVSFLIHGKLDAVIDSGDSVDVFDYKTRRAMTPAAIKGETKNDEGNYFRQLVFYKMLSQNDFYSRNKKLQTSLVFVSPDDHGRCPIVTLEVNQSDIKKVENEIKDLIQCVWSGEIVQKYCTQPNCRYCGYRKLVK